jgi:glycosyltransferase involved in cell wall biosynthesis
VVKPCAYVATVHDCIPRLFPEYAPSWLADFFARQALTWLRLADHLICVSRHTAHDLQHLYGLPPERMTVVYQSVAEQLQPVADSARVGRVQGKFGIDGPYVLTVGRVELRKNARGLRQALEVLRAEFPGLLLVWAGPREADAYDPEGILPVAGRQGPVVVTGYVTEAELAALYTGAAVFCFPSFYEGFGRPVLEAMQCGAPVVTSRVSSLPEVGGEACLYVSPQDPEEIAAALRRVLTDGALRAELVAAGRQRAAEFTAARQGRETWAVYERVLAGAA